MLYSRLDERQRLLRRQAEGDSFSWQLLAWWASLIVGGGSMGLVVGAHNLSACADAPPWSE